MSFFYTQKRVSKKVVTKLVLQEKNKARQEFGAEKRGFWPGAPEHIHVFEGPWA